MSVIIDEIKEQKGVNSTPSWTADDMKELVVRFKALLKSRKGPDFPSEPSEQLIEAVKAVFRSWENARAITYRRMNEIPRLGHRRQRAAMVFGNMGEHRHRRRVHAQPVHR